MKEAEKDMQEFKIGDSVLVNRTRETAKVHSLVYGKVIVKYSDEFGCVQIFEHNELTKLDKALQ